MPRQSTQTATRSAAGFTLVELLVVIAAIGILVALLLNAVQQARQSARQTECRNRLKQLGLALHAYHDTRQQFPAGYIGSTPDPTDRKGWGWGVMLLPYLEQPAVYTQLDPDVLSLREVALDVDRQVYLRTKLSHFRCPADTTEPLNMGRLLTGQMLGRLYPLHVQHPPPLPPPPPITPPPGSTPLGILPVATSSYVASFGSLWPLGSSTWSEDQLRGNGMFGCNTSWRLSDVTDGTSHTIALGERAWGGYAAVWAGVDSWDECHRVGNQMVLATTYYKLNQSLEPYFYTCDSVGGAGFSSAHPVGVQFVFADGSVRLLLENIDFRNSDLPEEMGVLQRLSARNDGQGVVDE